jgi:hypothetical protein
MALITVDADSARGAASSENVRALESGDILYLPASPFPFSDEDRSFLLEQRQVRAVYHKNISYRPTEDRLKGIDQKDADARDRMHAIMRTYSRRALDFLAAFLPQYAGAWKVDFASFRPNEEQGRRISHRSRNDLIHVDAFPSRPSSGDRLLRIFSNAHPKRARVWVTSNAFDELATRYGRDAGLATLRPPGSSSLRQTSLRLLSKCGVPVVDRSEYDRFMLRFHDYLKDSEAFQQHCQKDLWLFAPGSSWIVFTDGSSHSCVSGQYALEQTVIVRRETLVHPEKAPISVLEKMVGFPLAPQRARSA